MTSLWGPKYWEFFHTISAMYPEKPSKLDKKMALIFLKSIGDIIPCPKCANHYKKNLKKIPIKNNLDSRGKFMKWFVNFHNIVNKMLKKKIIPFKSAITKIKSFSKKNIIDQMNIILKYAMHILPEKSHVPIARKIGFQNFIKSTTYLANLPRVNKKKNIFSFINRTTYKKAHKNFIITLKKNKKK
jgi:hypothetical protein